MPVNILSVFLFAMVTALATGLGAIPLFFVRRVSPFWLSIASAVAGGLMGGASTGLIYEGLEYSAGRALAGVLLGLGFILVSNRVVSRSQLSVAHLQGASASKGVLILAIMTLHSFAEGVGVGVSFGGGEALGVFITTAIAVHNIPEGLAISLVMVPRGTSVWRAALWSVFSSLPQPLMAVPAFLFVEFFEPFLPVGLGFAAGAMIWMIFAEILPDALENASPQAVGTTVTLAFTAILAFQAILGG